MMHFSSNKLFEASFAVQSPDWILKTLDRFFSYLLLDWLLINEKKRFYTEICMMFLH